MKRFQNWCVEIENEIYVYIYISICEPCVMTHESGVMARSVYFCVCVCAAIGNKMFPALVR
jgi:hypothetical protein